MKYSYPLKKKKYVPFMSLSHDTASDHFSDTTKKIAELLKIKIVYMFLSQIVRN